MKHRSFLRAGHVWLVFGWLLPAPAAAQTLGDIWAQSTLLGNAGGIRPALATHGVTLTLQDTENLLGDVSGGIKQGATMQGVTTATLQVDTAKAFGWQGGTFNVSALQIHGRNFTPAYLDDLQAANGTEAQDSTRLWELWYDQSFAGGNEDVKIGQESIDQEFMLSKNSGLFVDTMAGWPLVPSDDLYGGGPAYPLSALGGRVQAKPTGALTMLAGVFDDNPAGQDFSDDPPSADAGGTRFNLNTGALVIAEVQVAATPFANLAGTYKLGFWYDTADYPDQALDDTGLSLADPDSDGAPLEHKGDYSVYGVVDQILWQTADGTTSVNGFMRAMGAPSAQNLISFSLNGGVVVNGPVPGRANDSAGFNVGFGQVSSQAAALDWEAAKLSGGYDPVRGGEILVEVTYQAQLNPWLQLQPVAQFVANPGGGILDPADGTRKLPNEVVVGMRANVSF